MRGAEVKVNMATMQVQDKELALYLALSFACGMLIGYQFKSWRLKYLKAKRDYLQRKMAETQKKLNQAGAI